MNSKLMKALRKLAAHHPINPRSYNIAPVSKNTVKEVHVSPQYELDAGCTRAVYRNLKKEYK